MFGTVSPSQTVARAAFDLRLGLPVRLGDAFVMAIEAVDAAGLAMMRSLGGDLSIAITDRRALTLKTAAYDGDIARLSVGEDMTLTRLQGIADPSRDLMTPLKGPFKSERGGDIAAHRAAIQLCKIAHLLPAALVARPENVTETPDLIRLTPELVAAEANAPIALSPVSAARVPLAVSEAGKVHVFRPQNGGEEHYAVEIGNPDRERPVLSRLHSACFTGDILGSLKCDCGPQLNGALAQIAAEGAGVLLYLNQEGRGIGLANKMRAYSLQDQGFDTVEANHRLGFEDDERDFRLGAQILRDMGFSEVRLLTNNPAKVAMMEECGVGVVERVPLKVGRNPLNADYLRTKAAKSGHLL